MSELLTENIVSLLESRAQLSPKTRSDILCVFKQVLRCAQDSGCAVSINARALTVRVPKKEMRVLSQAEQQRLTAHLLEDTDLRKLGVYLALCTGLRIGELCALRRRDYDSATGVLHIGGTMQRIQTNGSAAKTQVLITEPKSRCSVRDIPLPETITRLLDRFYNGLCEDAFLLTGSSSHFVEPSSLRYTFGRMTEVCELKEVHFHTLRHTFATRCVEAEVDVKTLSEILGHENVKITLSRYVHSSLELKRRSMEKLCKAE